MLGSTRRELAIQIQVEELPEGVFLATSEELPGLVAQGRTVSEALEIVRDVARRLIEARREREGVLDPPGVMKSGLIPVPIATRPFRTTPATCPKGRSAILKQAGIELDDFLRA